jgi:hypothetical protein
VEINADGSALTTTNSAHNTHGSLQQINGQWYVFYHRPPRGFGNARQAMVAPVKIEWDKKSVAQGGQVRITGYDPYAPNNEWTAKASNGNEYTGAEVTSEGFQIFGLNPYSYYSAGIACYMSDQNWIQDNHDMWKNEMELQGIKNGGIIGFKYFGFGGLAQNTKGCNAFAGTKAGDGTTLNLFITPRTDEAFKIHVMLDGPYANSAWNGKEIAVINVDGKQRDKALKLTAAVPAVEGLQGKHAIYFVVEGPEVKAPAPRPYQRPNNNRPFGLFDMRGMGFSKPGLDCNIPVVPTVDIYADGVKLAIPAKPIYTTQTNAYMECNRYQVYGKLTDTSKLEVKASDPSVQVKIGKINDGRATITCTYKGVNKIFLIN